ncbi:MAG: heme-binding protein [Kordiimonadaceae bacterium]|nr:heme-binding protein [Kordiimonadaceae bacterium]
MKKSLHRAVLALTATAAVAAITLPVAAQDMRAALTTKSAKAIIEGCQAFAVKTGLKVNISVFDQGRNMMAFLRMDGAHLGSIEIANWKASSSASFSRATKGAAERSKEFPALGHAPNIAIFEGGEAIFTNDGGFLGSVGVSGASSAQDAECGRAGIETAGLKSTR